MVIIYRYVELNGNMLCEFAFPDDLCPCGCDEKLFESVLFEDPSGVAITRVNNTLDRLRLTNLTVDKWEI